MWRPWGSYGGFILIVGIGGRYYKQGSGSCLRPLRAHLVRFACLSSLPVLDGAMAPEKLFKFGLLLPVCLQTFYAVSIGKRVIVFWAKSA